MLNRSADGQWICVQAHDIAGGAVRLHRNTKDEGMRYAAECVGKRNHATESVIERVSTHQAGARDEHEIIGQICRSRRDIPLTIGGQAADKCHGIASCVKTC